MTMRARWLVVGLALLPFTASAGPLFRVGADTSVILNVCLPELNGEGFLHVDEDVSGLVIQVVNSAGGSVALYDAAAEIEDVAVAGTWSAPSANNVRASPDAGSLDCTELQFADGVFDADQLYSLRISDGQATILDFTAQVVALSPMSDLSTAMQSASNAALVALALDHLMATAVTGTDVADNSVIARLVATGATADYDDFDNDNSSLSALNNTVSPALTDHVPQSGDAFALIDSAANAEPTTPPAANAALSEKIAWLFALARNTLIQDSSEQCLRNDGDSADIGCAPTTDDGMQFTRGEFAP